MRTSIEASERHRKLELIAGMNVALYDVANWLPILTPTFSPPDRHAHPSQRKGRSRAHGHYKNKKTL